MQTLCMWSEVHISSQKSFTVCDKASSHCCFRTYKRKCLIYVYLTVSNFKKWKQKACVTQQIMCYYHDSLAIWDRLESHLGSRYDGDKLTSLTNELDSPKWTTTFSTGFFFYEIWGNGDAPFKRWKGIVFSALKWCSVKQLFVVSTLLATTSVKETRAWRQWPSSRLG